MYNLFDLTDYIFAGSPFKSVNTTRDIFPGFNKDNFKSEKGNDEDGSKWTRNSYLSDDGTFYMSTYTRKMPVSKKIKEASDLDKRLAQMEDELNDSVIKEDWSQAANLRDKIKDLKNNSGKIKKLLDEKKKAIDSMEFEKVEEIVSKLNEFNK